MLRIEGVMGVLNLSRTWLAGELGMSQGQVTRLLRPRAHADSRRWTEEAKARAAQALGWPEAERELLFEEVDGDWEPNRVVIWARHARAGGYITALELETAEEVFG